MSESNFLFFLHLVIKHCTVWTELSELPELYQLSNCSPSSLSSFSSPILLASKVLQFCQILKMHPQRLNTHSQITYSHSQIQNTKYTLPSNKHILQNTKYTHLDSICPQIPKSDRFLIRDPSVLRRGGAAAGEMWLSIGGGGLA